MQRLKFKHAESNDEVSCLCKGHEIVNGELRILSLDDRVVNMPLSSYDPYSLVVMNVGSFTSGPIDSYVAELAVDLSDSDFPKGSYVIPPYDWEKHHRMRLLYSTIRHNATKPYVTVEMEEEIRLFSTVIYYVDNPSLLNQGLNSDTLYNVMGFWFAVDKTGIYRLRKVHKRTG